MKIVIIEIFQPSENKIETILKVHFEDGSDLIISTLGELTSDKVASMFEKMAEAIRVKTNV